MKQEFFPSSSLAICIQSPNETPTTTPNRPLQFVRSRVFVHLHTPPPAETRTPLPPAPSPSPPPSPTLLMTRADGQIDQPSPERQMEGEREEGFICSLALSTQNSLPLNRTLGPRTHEKHDHDDDAARRMHICGLTTQGNPNGHRTLQRFCLVPPRVSDVRGGIVPPSVRQAISNGAETLFQSREEKGAELCLFVWTRSTFEQRTRGRAGSDSQSVICNSLAPRRWREGGRRN